MYGLYVLLPWSNKQLNEIRAVPRQKIKTKRKKETTNMDSNLKFDKTQVFLLVCVGVSKTTVTNKIIVGGYASSNET